MLFPLSLSFFLLFITFFFVLFMPSSRKHLSVIKNVCFFVLSIIFLMMFLFCVELKEFSFVQNYYSIFFRTFGLNIHYELFIDNISVFFITLTSFLTSSCFLFSLNHFNFLFKEFVSIILIMQFLLINFFLTDNLLFFYICFEGVLLPLFILIGSFGSRQRRIHASFQMFFHTIVGSFFMLFNIIYIFIQKGSLDFSVFFCSIFPLKMQLIIWFFFFLSLSVKIPLFPFHIWLPEAHVEAPTIGSVILAGVLLKLGTYGLLRFIVSLSPIANWYFSTLVQILCFLAIVYISLITLCQIDLKKLIAYSSVAHMGYATIALFSFNDEGIISSIFLMLNHGIVSSLLFFIVGVIYDRYKTRIFFYYQTLFKYMPLFSFVCFWSMLANIGFPGTSSFVAEFLIMISIFTFSKLITFCLGLGLIFSAFYSFWIYNRIFFGLGNNKIFFFSDISFREFFVLFPLIFLISIFGIFPFFIIDTININVSVLYQNSFSKFFLI